MALAAPPTNDRKRVKVYELKNNDWFDRGTGFCTGQVINDESKIFVESEDEQERILLETKISKDDGYQKQQETLIVWTASNGTDMALSFQEADGCAAIWEFVSQAQQHLMALGPDDALSDDAMENFPHPVMLPPPELGNLPEIENQIRVANTSPQGRESLAKFLMSGDYIVKLVPMVETAEDLEALPDLHRLSNIMKLIILLNDTSIIELLMSDELVLGVMGALEYDQEFPSHKANHRRYLQNRSRFKEVVPINNPEIKKKIHSTWRLQYLKDVVLARILDDPTFSVLNSLIFFNQVDIVTHLQSNTAFLKELFSLIDGPETTPAKRKDAVCFIQQCCAIAKNLQAQARGTLYGNFLQNGLLNVIKFALCQQEAPVRIAGTDILVSMIDHDPSLVRATIIKAIHDKKEPLTATLIDLLLVENDLGVKAQAADAIKVLLDPQQIPPPEAMARGNEQFLAKYRGTHPTQQSQQTDQFVQDFYDKGAKKLFQPLKNLEKRETVQDLTFNEISLFSHLVEILMYFARQHIYRSKYFIAQENIMPRVGQLLTSPQKHMKLTALKFFRMCLQLQDDFYYSQMIQFDIFGRILDIVIDTSPRDNLLNSACLELFEFVKRENIKPVINHVVEVYRGRLQDITYVDLFEQFVLRYDQMQGSYGTDMEGTLFGQEEETTPLRSRVNGTGQRWQGVQEMDADEEHYFNTSDDEEDSPTKTRVPSSTTNGTSPPTKSLVDYPDDDDENFDAKAQSSFYDKQPDKAQENAKGTSATRPAEVEEAVTAAKSPPERLTEKRRREEDDEDELGKLSTAKRRSSSGSTVGSNTSGNMLRRKKSFNNSKEAATGKKIAISLSVKSPIETEQGGDGA